jgi:hypothetical protein
MTIAFALICSGIAAVSDPKPTETRPVAPPAAASGAGTCPAGHLPPRETAAPGEISH